MLVIDDQDRPSIWNATEKKQPQRKPVLGTKLSATEYETAGNAYLLRPHFIKYTEKFSKYMLMHSKLS